MRRDRKPREVGRAVLAAWIAAAVLMAGPAARADPSDPDWVLSTMTRELKRNQERLRLPGYEAPYFIAYTVHDLDRVYLAGRSGALFQNQRIQNRTVNVDVRVGDYAMDSSEDQEDLFNPDQKYVPNQQGPIERSEAALSRVLWLQSDFKYKSALMSYLKVRAKQVNQPKSRTTGSMTREEPVHLIESAPAFRFDSKTWEKAVRRLSGAFLDYPQVFDSSVEVSATRHTRYIVTTEGTLVKTVDDYLMVLASAVVRAEDGQLLEDSVYHYARSADGLPPPERIEAEIRAMAERLCRLREAPVLDPATVPVLMSPEATGVFFHETIGHRLEGQRQEDQEEGRTFKGHLGRRILPEFVDVADDPTLTAWDGIPLNGHYRVDDEGVRASRASLVESGVLRGFLLSRRPVEGFEHSNGHGRSDGFQRPVGRMATLVVQGRTPVSPERLREMLLEEVRRQHKPYGLIIETIAGGSTNTSSYGYQAFKGVPRVAYRVDAETGAMELVRGVEIVGTPLSSINKIVATSDRYGVFNGYCGAESGPVPVSTVAPEMLFAEIELQRSQDTRERAPVLPAPDEGSAH